MMIPKIVSMMILIDHFDDDSDDRFNDDSEDRFDDNCSSAGRRISTRLGNVTCCRELPCTAT